MNRKMASVTITVFLRTEERYASVGVPHSESGVVPMSSLSGVGLLGFWEFGMSGIIG
jgi:hypothetical protein